MTYQDRVRSTVAIFIVVYVLSLVIRGVDATLYNDPLMRLFIRQP